MSTRMRRWSLGMVMAAALAWPPAALDGRQQAPGGQQSAPAGPQEAPKDLRPLLGQPQSEMRLVVQRYTLDRNTLNGNYLPGGRSGGPYRPGST